MYWHSNPIGSSTLSTNEYVVVLYMSIYMRMYTSMYTRRVRRYETLETKFEDLNRKP
jgi:hypothetical protein